MVARASQAAGAHNGAMDRYERINALHRLLKSARYPVTVPRLQDELGCSRATVYRDLAFLRDGLMAPVVGDGEAGFRYDPGDSDRFELPGLGTGGDPPGPERLNHLGNLVLADGRR